MNKIKWSALYDLFLDLWWVYCSPADGRRLECVLLWWPWGSGEFNETKTSKFSGSPLMNYVTLSECSPNVNMYLMCFCLRSIGFSRSCSQTQNRWESCGWDSCAFTQKNLTSRSTSSASAKGNASPPLRNSGPANASPLKVICSSLRPYLLLNDTLLFYSLICSSPQIPLIWIIILVLEFLAKVSTSV